MVAMPKISMPKREAAPVPGVTLPVGLLPL
jgi:hypothetical protein